jgi:oligopeptide/dipeptide ABC transporter ATP-binding protein
MTSETPLLNVIELAKLFPLGGGILSRPRAWIRAVDNVSFSVYSGENFGLVGESGCGKTTLGRLILKLIEPNSGRIEFAGRNIFDLKRTELSNLRRQIQIIFQDPYSSLDPRMKVAGIITEPLRAVGRLSQKERRDVAAQLLDRVGLRRIDLDKYPHEFSGGQRQRIGIARALCVQPQLIVADEPVSALDVSIQAQVINLMEDLKKEFNLSYVFISHDLSVVEYICDRIAVMYLGGIVELASSGDFRESTRHPYTEALLKSVPQPDPHQNSEPFAMEGDVPNPIDPPQGCPFHPRCFYRFDQCSQAKPPLIEAAPGHLVACWLNEGQGL